MLLRTETLVENYDGRSHLTDYWIYARLLYLAPFDDARQLDYSQRYFECQTGATDHKRAHELLAEVCRHPGIHAISRVPSLLNLMAILRRRGVPLPDGRAELYSRIAETYLKTIDDARDVQRVGHGQLSHEEALRWLGIVAMSMQQRRSQQPQKNKKEDTSAGEIGASRADIKGWLVPFVPGTRHTPEETWARVDLFLDYVAARSGLLQPRGQDWFGFVHLTFMEYFTACYLQDELDHATQMKAARDLQSEDFEEAEYLAQHPAGPIPVSASILPGLACQPVWHEVLVFLAERHAMTGATAGQQLENLFRRLFPPLFSRRPTPAPAKDDNDAQPLLSEPAVALAMRLATDRFLATGDADRAAAMLRITADWRCRLWLAYLRWPHMPWMEKGWPIANHLLQIPPPHFSVLKELGAPAAVGFNSARILWFWKCPLLTSTAGLPEGVEELTVRGCSGLLSLSGLPGGLKILNLWECKGLTCLAGLPEGLQTLDLSGCVALRNLTGLPTSLRELDLYGCVGLSDLTGLPPGLETLNLTGCKGLTKVDELPPGLKRLCLWGFAALTDLPALPIGLEDLNLSECTGLVSLAGLPERLQKLNLWGCTSLAGVAGVPDGVGELDLSGCRGLTSLVGLSSHLQSLNLGDCTGLTSLVGLPEQLQKLNLSGCIGLTSLAGLPAGVQKINLRRCTRLASTAGIPPGVQELELGSCKALTTVDELPDSLTSLGLWNCTGLTKIEKLPSGLTWLDLEDCTTLERVDQLPPRLNGVHLRNTPRLPESVKAEIRALVKRNGGTVLE